MQTVCKWKICKTGAGINKHFLTESYQGRRTENRKCSKCEEVVTASNSGTSATNKHYKRCSVPNMPLKRPRGQSHLGMTKIPKDDDTTRGLHEVSRLVYEDNLPIYKVIRSPVLQNWLKNLNFANVIYHSFTQRWRVSMIPVFNRSRISFRKDRKLNHLQFLLTSGQQKTTKNLLVHTYILMEKLFVWDWFYMKDFGALHSLPIQLKQSWRSG